MQFKLTFEDGSDGYLAQAELDPKEVERRRYAFPEERKFPLTDASKVMSAIKFFNYVDPKNERHLAEAILKRMEELGISEVNVGPNNRFKKYYEVQDGYLEHFGVKGMHWGVWNEETRARRMGSFGASKRKARYDRLATSKEHIKKGQAAARVSQIDNERHSGSTYATLKKDDWQNYSDIVRFNTGKAYRYDMEVTKNLVGPSERERIDVFIEMLDDPAYKDKITKGLKKAAIIPKTNRYVKKETEHLSKHELGRSTQKRLSFLLNSDESINSEYAKRMMSKGYQFVTDDFDRLTKMSETPTIFLDREHSLKTKRISEI